MSEKYLKVTQGANGALSMDIEKFNKHDVYKVVLTLMDLIADKNGIKTSDVAKEFLRVIEVEENNNAKI